MKKTSSRQLILGGVITVVIGFSCTHAEAVQLQQDDSAYCSTNTAICGTAPKQFTLLLGFVREMMNAIKTIWTQWNYVGKYINPNWFEGNTFVAPKSNILSATVRNVTQKLEFGVAALAIVSSPVNGGGLKDVAGWVALLLKNKVFLRDNKLVEELESQLSDKKLELGLGWGRYTKTNAANRALMQAIIKKYIDNWLLVDGQIADGVLYNNITSLLTQVLSSAKTVLYLDRVSQFDSFSRWGSNGISIVFNTASMQNIQRDYACARWFVNPCDSSLKSFTGAIHTLVASRSDSVSWSVKVITNALDRLGQTFTKSSDQTAEFKAREADLLKSMYGTKKINKGTFFSFKVDSDTQKVIDALKKDGVVIWKAAVSLWTFLTKDVQSEKQQLVSAKEDQNIMPSNTPTAWQPIFEQYLNSYLQDVFAQQATDSELATFAEVNNVTAGFSILWKQVDTIKTKILGGKDQDGSLIKSLGEACELQCGRGGTCR